MSEETLDVERLSAALMDAYFTPAQLETMLYRKLGWDLFQLAPNDSLEVMVPRLIRRLEADGKVGLLIDAACADRPGNPLLEAFYRDHFHVGDATEPPGNLEQIVRATNEFVDMASFWKRAGEIQRRVCLIEVDGSPAGTGFLVGPSRVLTNDHVITRDDGSRADGDDIVCRFDYTSPKAATLRCSVAPGGVLDRSPWSKHDSERDPKSGLPGEDELDFALLQLDGAPDEDRGIVEIPGDPHPFKRDTPLLIVQHPAADTMKLAIDMQAILRVNANRTRVRYRTNTLPGSSGSPCFDAGWRLIALHHAGDPRWTYARGARYNEGIPIDKIRARLTSKGLL